MTTIDLLLVLGGKLADVLQTLLDRRVSRTDRKKIEELLQQYEEVRGVHSKAARVIESYNEIFARGIVQGDLDDLFSLCTARGYRRARREVEQLRKNHVQNRVRQQSLASLDLLTVRLVTRTIERRHFLEDTHLSVNIAKAYVAEKWVTTYLNGTNLEQEIICCYDLVQMDDSWKVDGGKVFLTQGGRHETE